MTWNLGQFLGRASSSGSRAASRRSPPPLPPTPLAPGWGEGGSPGRPPLAPPGGEGPGEWGWGAARNARSGNLIATLFVLQLAAPSSCSEKTVPLDGFACDAGR